MKTEVRRDASASQGVPTTDGQPLKPESRKEGPERSPRERGPAHTFISEFWISAVISHLVW